MNGSHRYEKTSQVATFPKPGPFRPIGSSSQFTMPSFESMIRHV